MASRRPRLPKQTLLQKRTLAIQVATAIRSSVIRSLPPSFCDNSVANADLPRFVGDGTIAGLTVRSTAVPERPTAVDNPKPVHVRSTIYHRQGLTRASVSEACMVDCH